MTKRVLMVVTNHTTITDDHKTGLWLEEFGHISSIVINKAIHWRLC